MTLAEEVAEQSRAIRARMSGEGAKTWEIVGAIYHHHWHASLACKEARPELAIAHLREVEAAQRIVASGATGGGEGRMYTHDLYKIMAERARLHERLAERAPR